MQVDCDNLITPELPVRKISHDLPYQVTLSYHAWLNLFCSKLVSQDCNVAGLLGGGCKAGFLEEKRCV